MKYEQKETCQVCFVKPHRLFEYSQILRCVSCGSTCHRSCYFPSFRKDQFECDTCQYSQKRKEICFLCGNHGMLKKVEDQFAHPICLLFSSKAIVLEYSSLTFGLIKTVKREKDQKKSKCSICKKPGEVQKCYAECSNQVHMYCAWKSYQEENGWNHNTIVENLQYSFYFEKKAKSYLQPVGQTIISLIDSFSLKVNRNIPRQFELACPNHIDTIFQCCTQDKYFHQTQIDYIQCDQCFRWYHKDCLDNKAQSKQDSTFICFHCHNFWKLIKSDADNQIYLKRFPRLNICELIYVQYLFEKKKYRLTKSQTKFLFSLPIQPSLIFIQEHIKKNISSRLKVQHFKNLCKLNFGQRIDKKQFKDKFIKKYQPILTIITETKSLFELREEYEGDQLIKSQKHVQDQERQKLIEWISMLDKFKNNYKEFNEIISHLIKKLRNWLKSLSKQEEDTVKSFEQESMNSSAMESQSVKVQSNITGEVKAQEMSSEQQSSIQNTYSESSSRYQTPERSQLKNSYQTSKKFEKKGILQEEKENFSHGDQSLETKIQSALKLIRKNLNHKKINKQKLTLKVLNKHQDKIFFLQTILDQKLPLNSVLKAFLLEAILKNIFILIENHNITENNLNQDRNEAQTTFSGEIPDRSRNGLKNITKTKIIFLEKFRDKIFQIYYNCDNQIKKKFKQKIQFLSKSLDDFIDVLGLQKNENPTKKLTFDETVQKFMQNPNTKGFSQTLKAQIKSSFDQNQLLLLRLQIEKKKIYVQIKNIVFNRLSSTQIGHEYENYCKSSSEDNASSSENKIHSQLSLREQILGLQKKALQQWIKMFGFTFNLANQLLSLERKDNEESMLSSKASFIDKEPLTIIDQFLSIDYTEKNQLRKSVFRLILIFFWKIKESLINYRIFHPSFVSIVQKLAKFSIQYSIYNVSLWTEEDLSLSTIRFLYKEYHKFFLVDRKNVEIEKFKNIWHIFQIDELYSEYLQENKNFIFKDPQVTEEILKNKIPQMIAFYQQSEFICRVKQIKRIRIWISYYLRCLFIIGPQNLVEEQFLSENIRKKFQNDQKISFNQLAIIISELHRVKFPQCTFTKTIINIFNKARLVENEIQSFFDKNSFCLDESYALKQEFQSTYNVEKDCINFKDKIIDEKKHKISSAEYKKLISLIENNEVSQIITFDIEKYSILDQRNGFKRSAIRAQEIMKTKDELIPIKELNLIYFQILSYPFHYVNLHVFLLFITKRVQRQQIYGNLPTKNKLKQKQYVAIFQKAFGQILLQLESNSKMMCRTLTRQQVIKKIQQISEQSGFKNVQNHPTILKIRQQINQKIEKFDKIKSSLSKLSQKVNLNKTLQHQEIEELDTYISIYKAQKIYEFTFQILSSNLEQYKLAFSAIPDDPSQRIMALQQLKSLKKPFKTKELLRKINELQKTLKKF